MSEFLDGTFAKIKRAYENVVNLNREIDTFLQSNPYRIVRKLDDQGLRENYRVFPEKVPVRFAVMAGEIVHNLRSSLDHMVCAHVLSRGGTVDKQFFPISSSENAFKNAFCGPTVDCISGKFRARVAEVQPYHRGDLGAIKGDPLSILHDYSNTDKHRVLPLTRVVFPALNNPAVTDSGEDLFHVEFEGERSPDFKVEVQLPTQIAFTEFGFLKNQAVVPSLAQLAKHVRKTVASFEPVF